MNYSNNAFSVIVGAITNADTIIALAAGTGSRFPASDFRATLVGYDANGNEDAWEIVHCSSRSGDVLTVTRGQEGTSAAAWGNGARIENRVTAGSMAALEPTITPGTTAQYLRGDKTWRDFFTDVRAATLTGLSTATKAAVSATDTVLAAIGKLQAQMSAKFDKTGGNVDGVISLNWTGALPQAAKFTSVSAFGDGTGSASVGAVAPGNAQGQRAGVTFFPTFIGTGDNGPRRAADIWASYSGIWGAERLSLGVGRGVGGNDGGLATIERLALLGDGSVLAVSGPLGYGVGAGGTVVQATSKSTTVTLNKPTGQITMNNAALAAGASVTFQFSNNLITTVDALILTIDAYSITGIPTEKYSVAGSALASGANITLKNVSAGSLSEELRINFTIIKGATS